MHGRHTKVRPHHWLAGFVAVAVVLALALGLRLLGGRLSGDEPVSRATDSAATSASSAARELGACRTVWRAQTRVLGAAGSSLEQWRIHVDAMNRLVAGEITLAQATAFWNRTRQGAAARVARFEAVDGEYADASPQCAGLAHGTAPARSDRALEDCVAGLRARDRAIVAGDVAIATWKHHIMDMEMLRAGQISATQATRMWLRSWRRGVQELDRFTTVRGRAADAGSC